MNGYVSLHEGLTQLAVCVFKGIVNMVCNMICTQLQDVFVQHIMRVTLCLFYMSLHVLFQSYTSSASHVQDRDKFSSSQLHILYTFPNPSGHLQVFWKSTTSPPQLFHIPPMFPLKYLSSAVI